MDYGLVYLEANRAMELKFMKKWVVRSSKKSRAGDCSNRSNPPCIIHSQQSKEEIM